MITIACDERAFDFFRGPVASAFYERTAERLRVLPEGGEGAGRADFVVVPETRVRKKSRTAKAVRSLNGYRKMLADCDRGGVGPFSFDDGDAAVGLRLELATDDPPELPELLDFLNLPEKLTLGASSAKALQRRGKRKFFYLTALTQAIAHHLPLIPERHVHHTIHVGKTSQVRPKSGSVSVRTVLLDPKKSRAVIDLGVTNNTERALRGLEAYFFQHPVKAFPNADGQAVFASRVNRVGPVPGFRFGRLEIGDNITRRVQYDISFGDEIPTSWTTWQLAQDNGDGWGNGCSEKQPEPLPDDPVPTALESGCFDSGCQMLNRCNPHICLTGPGGCGCWEVADD
jgi:hypothetical protein